MNRRHFVTGLLALSVPVPKVLALGHRDHNTFHLAEETVYLDEPVELIGYDQIVIENCRFYNCGDGGIVIKDSQHVIIQNCTFFYE